MAQRILGSGQSPQSARPRRSALFTARRGGVTRQTANKAVDEEELRGLIRELRVDGLRAPAIARAFCRAQLVPVLRLPIYIRARQRLSAPLIPRKGGGFAGV